MKIVFIILIAALLSACASIPLATMQKMGTFDEKAFANINPEDVRVRIALPIGFTISDAKTFLRVALGSGEQSTESKLVLQTESSTPTSVGGGVFSGSETATEFTLKLTGNSMGEFKKLQALVASSAIDTINIDVNVGLGSKPDGAQELRAWVKLKVSSLDGYFTLVDGGKFPIDKAESHQIAR